MKKEKNPKIFLEHIAQSINEIERNIDNMSEDEFLKLTTIQDAVIRRLQIVGEAVKNLPTGFKKKYPKIEWREIAGMRDKLIHEYFGVDIELVWEIANKDIPIFKKQILEILKCLE